MGTLPTSGAGARQEGEEEEEEDVTNKGEMEFEEVVMCKAHDGSDSGVEVNGGGVVGTPVASCDSSLLSCYSSEDLVGVVVREERDIGDGTSEGGSESSSVASNKPPNGGGRRRTPVSHISRPTRASQSQSREKSRTLLKERSLSRTSRPTPPPVKPSSITKTTNSTFTRSVTSKTIETPRGRPVTRVKSPLATGSIDDGRWPSSITKSQSVLKKQSEKKMSPMTSSVGPVERVSSPLDKYATLPRRRRRSAENLLEVKINRDPSLNRAASLRRKKVEITSNSNKTIPPYPVKQKAKTRIYHEICVQTALTGQDVEAAVAGQTLQDVHSRVEIKNVSVQVERRFELAEKLEGQVKHLQEKVSKLLEEKSEFEKIKEELQLEREIRQKQEERIKNLLPNLSSNETSLIDSLEKEFEKHNDICRKQQLEISHFQGVCATLKRELEKSLAVQKKIMQQQQEVEAESIEMQEFLQAEKSTLADTLKDLENEVFETQGKLLQKEADLLKQQEECSHLVRVSEQLRQEKLSLEARLRAVETYTKETMLQHGAAVSRSSVALSRLGNRLENLVEALVAAYNISDRDLEDVIFHNEVFSSSSSTSSSVISEGNSPQHKASGKGLMAAILNAIRTATTRSTPDTYSEAELLAAEPEPASFSHRDFTSPSSPGEGKRHSIASIPSLSDLSPIRHSHRASFAASDDFEICVETSNQECERILANSESLQNLSDAIMQRKKQEEEVVKEMQCHHEVATSLVDQVIEVDNLITKLLKVLQIIQMSSEKLRSIEKEERLSVEQTTSMLRSEIEELNLKLKCNEMSSKQVEELQNALSEREKELGEMEKRLGVTQDLLTSNWHKAMSEVRRQYDAIDSALDILQTVQNDVQENPILLKLQKQLEETNFHSATTLPVSTSQPDLNANAAVTQRTINGQLS